VGSADALSCISCYVTISKQASYSHLSSNPH